MGVIAGIAGLGGFIAALFAVGSFMEEDWRKFWISVAAFVILGAVAFQGPESTGGGSSSDCYIDWDGRSNPEVCD